MDQLIELLKNNGINVIEHQDTKTPRQDGDIIYKDKIVFDEIITNAGLGVGETYMKELWECHNNRVDVLIYKILKNNIQKQINPKSWRIWFWALSTYYLNYQTKTKSFDVENVHYNIDNELYRHMLGPSMAYTCAYFKNGNEDDLNRAQFDKFQLICDKIQLNSNDKILDIGCGFGTLAKYMVEKYNCEVTGINISTEQLKFANEIQNQLHNTSKTRLSFINSDWRDITGNYNKIISIGLCEHIGYRNYRTFFETVYNSLENGNFSNAYNRR